MSRLAPVLLTLLLAAPVFAGGKGDDVAPRERVPDEDLLPPTVTFGDDGAVATATRPVITPRQRFVQSSIIETLYHELGHALIDILDLPIFGSEEFAADVFSVILMNRLHDEDGAIRLAYDAAGAYSEDAQRAQRRGEENAEWDIHGSDLQRYYNLVCLFYGAAPDEREDMAQELGLPEQRAQTCPEEFDLVDRSWGGVLDKLAVGTPGKSITMDWVLREDDALTVFVTGEVARLNRVMRLPENLAVSVIPATRSTPSTTPASARSSCAPNTPPIWAGCSTESIKLRPISRQFAASREIRDHSRAACDHEFGQTVAVSANIIPLRPLRA
ncbi:DUF4344 domain-containing metallopeptidase [Aliiroseovarius sp.]|uniref:DUF4344 domain-containing metallopeptidase n=1 Tax=Aliiroseovarius sp. TaxID=1872442 RepID=UPI0026273F8D|nr:DUF4344 domain-containing metallopeptidase [Aliiroseovarius sp.]